MPRSANPPNERLRAIELLLLWEGRVSRRRMLGLFATAPAQISRDLGDFKNTYPTAMYYDTASWSYIAEPGFRPSLTRGKFEEYVRLLEGSGSDPGTRTNIPFDSASTEIARVAPRVFSALHGAVREQRQVSLTYRSLREPEPHVRTVRPHAFGQAGPRWHLRAYCAETGDFRDFNVARIQSVKQSTADDLPGSDADADWNTRVPLCLEPHEGLTPAQHQLVRDEYCAGTTALVLTVRVAMLRYVIQAYRAAFDPKRERAPEHLLMVNRPERLPPAARWRMDES